MLTFRRVATLSLSNFHHAMRSGFSSRASWTKEDDPEHLPSFGSQKGDSFGNYSDRLQLSPLFKEDSGHDLKDLKIELVDNDSWQFSSGLAEAWKVSNTEVDLRRKALNCEDKGEGYGDIEAASYAPPDNETPDFDEIEDMRIRGILYYKLDKDSREYEECKFDFHRKKSSKNKSDQKENSKKNEMKSHGVATGAGKEMKTKDESRVSRQQKLNSNYGLLEERFHEVDNNHNYSIPGFHEMEGFTLKKVRTHTFNQLTAPYHEPFCLDLYVSKGSVRASIIHRATSKVVAVAHSISKDMKFDLGSTKSRSTCVAVGEVLAQRALEDDIHNVVYTPRKGDKLEGKLQIVLQSIIDHGVAVKVKLKQRKVRKGGSFPPKS
ncbi:OLC1v1020040C1 [Oldenlandia corymbosa var. corymbosa]|uniref:OLC1v1020040C1 n=1 Tax=Oldenlandia corymbosa var. corymbosa TaxID=529605 RepID=A0AAV1EFK9_OLDCO|nr:OLC1v1020040C1 [Oldenlandia corymbosa var. corymbosa]